MSAPDDLNGPPSAGLEPRPGEGAAPLNSDVRHDPYAAFRFRSFRFYMSGNVLAIVGRQMLGVAVEWEIYARTHSATALGLVGLVIGVPVILLSLPAGHFADRFSRKHIIMLAQGIGALASAALAFVSFNHATIPAWPILRRGNDWLSAIAALFERHQHTYHFDDRSIPLIFVLLLIVGIARTFAWAARSSFFPTLVPREIFPNAVTWNISVFQIGSVIGPALSGFVIARYGFPAVYAVDAVSGCVFLLLLLPIPRAARFARDVHQDGWRSLVAGLQFVFSKRIILATITLDMFAVLLGGATALLPMFADQILHCGPVGLGWMRAAPAVGALATGLLVAYLPPIRQAGRTLLGCVAAFGAITIVFGLSQALWLSVVALFLLGAVDSVSVIIRSTIVQLVTPDEMRGRVSAVNNIFIGTSNELGALESGLTAALFGPIVSVVGGGMGTILVVLGVAKRWPETRRIGALDRTLQ